MLELSLRDAVAVMGGRYRGDAALLDKAPNAAVIDSREVIPGALFFAITGGNRDGHDFVPAAMSAGALCAVVSRELPCDIAQIIVPDTVAALQATASRIRSLYRGRVIGLTGSAGKTTTKELTACVLSEKYVTQKTFGSYNNQTGLPLTLLSIKPGCEYAVVELGTNHFGEIAGLAEIARPHIALFTNIGTAHLEHFKTREGILKEKSEILYYLEPGGVAVINGEDDMLLTLKGRCESLVYGFRDDCDLRAEEIEDEGLSGAAFTLCRGDKRVRTRINAPGAHMISNALCAAGAGIAAGMDPEAIARGIEKFSPPADRGAVTHANGITVVNDAYNANPAAVRAAIDVLRNTKGRRVAVLGDMYELGDDSRKYHAECGRYAKEAGIELVIGVGELARDTAAAAGGLWFATQEELISALPYVIERGDAILIKGSHSLHLTDTANALIKG